ncbi:MAG: S9 family peptidase [Tannerella sp.]|jgi:dipeptidyl aminopeptidase/acylaminoacyl peptidase|nr:S9 family peptidase [Tannerella sp.]
MKLNFFALLMSVVVMIAGCEQKEKQPSGGNSVPETSHALTAEEIAAGKFTPEVMWKMRRVGNSVISPVGRQVAYTVTCYDMAENRGVTKLFVQSSADEEPRRLTDAAGNEGNLQWNRDGSRLYFLSDRSGDNQIWSIRPDGSALTQHSFLESGIDGFGITPDESKAFYTKSVPVEKRRSKAIYADMEQSQAKIYDDLMVRHWNYWDEGKYSHIFVAPFTGGKVGEGRDILDGEPWDAPMAPYFDIAGIAWNHAGTQLAYTCKKQTGTAYAVSTDSDIFIYDVESGSTRNICKDGEPVDPRSETPSEMGGYDQNPVWSPDDRKIAFCSMHRAGNESDKERLFVWNSENGSMKDLTETFDYNAGNVVWNGNEELYFIAPIEATHQICRIDSSGIITALTRGDHDINAFTTDGHRVIAEVSRITMAAELFDIALRDGASLPSTDHPLTPFTHINKDIYDHIPMGQVEKRWVTTTDGKRMLTWVIFPPDFDPGKKYPTLLYCQGGPQSVVSQFWSYRWNFQLMAAEGYIVVAPNRRGVPSFGQSWLDQISGDYSGQNIRDYLSAIDDVARESWCDETRLGCVGASYGGYSAFFLAGNHDKRFKAFIAHCGIFNFESMYGSTEELWFVNNDYKGAYWDENATAQRSYANSPHKFVGRWDTPILIITGLNDYRIPYTQSLEAFTAARLRNIPARLVVFENEGHQVFKPQNSIVWNREFFGWLEKYLK